MTDEYELLIDNDQLRIYKVNSDILSSIVICCGDYLVKTIPLDSNIKLIDTLEDTNKLLSISDNIGVYRETLWVNKEIYNILTNYFKINTETDIDIKQSKNILTRLKEYFMKWRNNEKNNSN